MYWPHYAMKSLSVEPRPGMLSSSVGFLWPVSYKYPLDLLGYHAGLAFVLSQ